MILAIEYLHDEKVIYRDLKPENLMLGGDANLKMVDFGFGKFINSSSKEFKTKTMCGTFGYLAPEILHGLGYDHRIDIWSIGVMICEMLGGVNPFFDKDPQEMFRKIENKKVNWSARLDKYAKDLVT